MLRSMVGKVMWAGKATVFMMGLALMVALVFGMASTAFGANGGNFILGSLNNSATAITKLTGTVGGGPALRVSNPSTVANSTALDLQVAANKPPMKVGSGTKVTNLNADKLDGKNSRELGQLWAVVNYTSFTDCTLVRGSGATSTAHGNFCGVRFDRNISNCAFIAGLSEPASGYPGLDRTGETWAFIGDNDQPVPDNDPNTVYVRTATSSGAKTPLPFHVAVVC
jgi:hypothetical protein